MILNELINDIWFKYVDITRLWKSQHLNSNFNLKKVSIKKVSNDGEMYKTIIDYRNFIFENFELIKQLKYLKEERYLSNFSCRTKNLNSIDAKLIGYIESEIHNYGEVPTIKCFNDLLGFRYIYPKDENITIPNLLVIIKDLGLKDNIKVIDSDKIDGYKAIHIYFKYDNYSFPWELQLWKEADAQNNKENHEKYKQKYVTREIEYKTEENKKIG